MMHLSTFKIFCDGGLGLIKMLFTADLERFGILCKEGYFGSKTTREGWN